MVPPTAQANRDHSIGLTKETLKALYGYVDTEGKFVFSLSEIKNDLYFLISKIATTNQ